MAIATRLNYNVTVVPQNKPGQDDPNYTSRYINIAIPTDLSTGVNGVDGNIVGTPQIKLDGGAYENMVANANGSAYLKKFSNLAAGSTHTVTYKDGRGERVLLTGVIKAYADSCHPLSFYSFDVINDGIRILPVITGDNGAAALLYSVDGGATFPFAPPGSSGHQSFIIYNVELPNTDTIQVVQKLNGSCTDAFVTGLYVKSYELIVTYDKQDVSFFGGSDGSIDMSVSNGSGTYTYQWADGPTTQDRSGLPAGTYQVLVTDTINGLTKNVQIVIGQPAQMTASFVKTDVTVSGGSDGTITLFVLGGSGNFQFNWSDGSSAQNRTGLVAGVYSVVIQDLSGGQSIQLDVEIKEPAPPEPAPGTFIDVPFMNSLTFVKRAEENCSNPQQLDNRLFKDQVYPGYKKEVNYFNKIAACDPSKILQFNSDYQNFEIQLRDYCTDELIRNFPFTLKEKNIGNIEQFAIRLTDHPDVVNQTRVYFEVGAPPIPLEVGDTFTIVNSLDGFNGDYNIVNIANDALAGYPYLVISKQYTPTDPSVQADGRFYVDTTNFDVFESLLNFDSLEDGQYWVVLQSADGNAIWDSEPIEVAAEHEGTNLVKYRNRDNAFGMTWTTGYIGELRVESVLFKRIPGGERSMSRNANFSLTKVNAKKSRILIFETFMLPPYLHEKLSVAFDCDAFTINDIACQASDGYGEPAYIDRFGLSNSSIKVEQQNWFGTYNSDDIGSVADGGFLQHETGFIKL